MRRHSAALLVVLTSVAAHCGAGEPRYRVTDRIAVPDARWDYGAIDPESRRLYLGRIGGVLALDLDTRAVTAVLVPSALVHGIVPLGRGLLMSTNGEADTVSVFDGRSGRELAAIPTGKEPDAIVLEPRSGLVITTNEESHDLSLIDPNKRERVGTIPLPGKPEYAAAGGNGLLFDNIENLNEIAVIDVAARRVMRTMSLPGCSAPTGLAYDAADDLLLAVCRNGTALFLNGHSGEVIATINVGAGPDAAIFDVPRHRAFVPAGGPGSLTVLSVRGTEIAVLQTIATRPGSRTAVLDPATGRVYVPAADFRPAPRPGDRSVPVAGSFEIQVIEPTL